MAKSYQNVIAIDGPSGSGKSTLAKKVSQELGILYIDTGSMFRAVALILSELGVDVEGKSLTPEDEQRCHNLFAHGLFQYALDEDHLVVINGENLTLKIREHHVSALASKVSQFPLIRDFLAKWQRDVASDRFCVLEGRDIGTVIFPNAFLKIFLTAKPEIRAHRRLEELRLRGEIDHTYESILADIIDRDLRDSTRAIAPLKKAQDAIELDTTTLTPDEVLQSVVKLYRSKMENKQ